VTETAARIEQARALLNTPEARPSALAALCAAAMAATAAVLMAGVMVLGPGIALEEPIFASPPVG
jgi:hypothetical protein